MENRDIKTNSSTNEVSDSVEIDLLEVFFYVWERIWIIILCAVMCGGAAYISSNYFMTEQYESTVTAWVMSSRNDTSTTINYNDIQVNSQMANDYIEIITSRKVLEDVIRQEGLDVSEETLSSRLRVAKKTDTRMITITVTDTDPERAQSLANAVFDIASKRIVEVMEAEEVNVTLVDEANLPVVPSSPNVKRYTVLGALVGAFLSVVLIICLFMLDDTIKTDEDVERYLGFTTLAVIPLSEESAKGEKSGKRNSQSKAKRSVSSGSAKKKSSTSSNSSTEEE